MGRALGFLFTWVTLTGFFYIVVTPIALIGKLSGKQFIEKDFKQKKPTYWKDTQVIGIEKESYRKQY